MLKVLRLSYAESLLELLQPERVFVVTCRAGLRGGAMVAIASGPLLQGVPVMTFIYFE